MDHSTRRVLTEECTLQVAERRELRLPLVSMVCRSLSPNTAFPRKYDTHLHGDLAGLVSHQPTQASSLAVNVLYLWRDN